MCAKLKVNRLNSFRTGACQVFTTQKPFPGEIPPTQNYLKIHFLIKLPSFTFLLKSMHTLRQINHSFARKKVNF